MNANLDVLIVGGGMVGLTMAAALADSGLKIALLEKHHFNDTAINDNLSNVEPLAEAFDLRVSAISPGNQAFLKSLGVWQNIPTTRIADYDWMRVWDADGSGKINFNAAELAQPILGSIVENQVLIAALYKKISQSGSITMLTGVEITQIIQSENSSRRLQQVVLSDQSSLQVKLIIGADGAHSATRKLFDINSNAKPYHQQAFVANVRTEKPHENTAWQRFTATGPVAFLPLPQADLCSVVWSVDDYLAAELKQLSEVDFAQKLATAFEHRLGKVELVSNFQAFPLVSQHTEHYLQPGLALIGDAAHSIHPLAGQGVNLGLQDVQCLNELMQRLREENRDFTMMANLRPFERARKAANANMLNAMGSLKWGFAQQTMGITILRNAGMNLIDKTTIIKQTLIRQAMGI